jgi:O-antigen/teichoic acid export membrane protein
LAKFIKLPALSPTSWLTAKNLFSQAFAILVFAIQAPLLGPHAFGLVSIVMVFIGFCEIVLADAISESLISIREVESAHFDTVNSINLLGSILFGAIVFLSAGAAARLFGDAELAPILRLMAILPAISSLAAAPAALAKRDLMFQTLALRGMASLLVGGTVGLVLTLLGWGVWALVWQALFTRLAATIVLWMAVPLRLRFGFSRTGLADLMTFALPTLLSRGVSWGTGQFPRFIFGLYWGATELGLFGLGARLCDILLELTLVPRYAAARVELRRFAADPAGLKQAAEKLFFNMSLFAFPLCIGGAAIAPTLFHAWLDARWYGGILPAALMMLMCAPFVTHYCAGAVLLAMNQQSSEARMSILQTAVTLIVVLLFAPLGLIPATAAFAARPLLLLPIPARLLATKCGISGRAIFESQRPALIAAGLMGIGVTALRIPLEPHVPNGVLLPLLVAAGATIYCAMISTLLPAFVREFLGRFSAK